MTFNLGPLTPVPTTLAAAVAAAPTIPDLSEFAREEETEPDFATLFTAEHTGPIREGECASDDDCPACYQILTPRLAWLLHTGAEVAVDNWISDAKAGQDEFFEMTEGELPRLAQWYAVRTPGWLEQFLGTMRDLGLQVAAGRVPFPNSTAEEVALHVILREAAGYLTTIGSDRDSDWDSFTQLPVHAASGDHDDDLDTDLFDALTLLDEILFEDDDVSMLFHLDLDGIEDDEDMIDRMGLANLHPRDWFTPFRAEDGDNEPAAA